MIVLIPSYEPDERLLELVAELRGSGTRIVVIDDGSESRFRVLFDRAADLGAVVLHQDVNTGKAAALRSGLEYIAARWPGRDVVTADSDGQHAPVDIAAVAAAMDGADEIILGGRGFSGDVPLRSRFGNGVSRLLFRLSSGVAVHDTQTGLRGIPAALIPMVLAVPGERFAWEMNVLLSAARQGIPIREVPISTIYLDHNASSHFRPVRDSLAVMRPLWRYLSVSVGSFLLDVVALQLMFAVTGMLLPSVIGARVLSAAVNFALNRTVVFHATEPGSLRRQLVQYVLLAVGLLAAGYAGIAVLTAWGAPLLVAKIVTDATVYLVGFLVQRGWVFAATRRRRATPQQSGAATDRHQLAVRA